MTISALALLNAANAILCDWLAPRGVSPVALWHFFLQPTTTDYNRKQGSGGVSEAP
jgi:hypothetical protein